MVVVGSVDRTGGLGNLPDDVMKYINQGEPPMFFGFGSMTNEIVLKPVWESVVAAVKELKIKRAIFHVTKFDKKFVEVDPPEGVFILDRPVPHAVDEKLFSSIAICDFSKMKIKSQKFK